MRIMFNSKLHRATVTECDLNYEGSISIDEELIKAADMLPYEKVDIYIINIGSRFSTYKFPAEPGSGRIGLNGAAARMCQVGDKIIIVSYKIVLSEELLKHKPKIILLDENNKILNS